MDNIYTTLAKLQDVTNRTPIMESDTAGNIENLKKESTKAVSEDDSIFADTALSMDNLAKLKEVEETAGTIKAELKDAMMSRLAELAGVPLSEIEEAAGESETAESAASRIASEVVLDDEDIAEAKDTHCSDKCCGSDVKAEDCNCPPDCKHCNCNAVSESSAEDERAHMQALAKASEPERGEERKKVSLKKAPWEESVDEAVGDSDSVRNIDSILTSMNADHPGDIIADILHWCDAKNEDFNDLIRRGTDYYHDEKEMAGESVEEAVGDSAESIWELCDELDCAAHPVFSELVRYLDGDTLQDFVADFRRHNDMNEGAVNEADIDENAFNQAAAAAARAGKKDFEFGGKTHKTTMSKDTAHKLDDNVQVDEEEKVEETTTAGAVATDASGNGKSLYKHASVYEGNDIAQNAMRLMEGMNINVSMNDQSGPSLTVTATDEDAAKLGSLLQLAGLGSLGMQHEAVAEDQDFANAADDTATADTETLVNTISGGLNRQKQQVNPNNPGDNALAMQGMGNNTVNLEDITESHLMSLYQEFKTK